MPDSPDSHARDADRLIFAGLLGLAAAGAIQLSDKSDLDLGQLIEVYAFAVAIPLLAVGLITDYARRAGTHIPPWRDALGLLGAGAAVVGLAGLFFHFGIGPGVVLVSGVVIGIILVRLL
jgi:hypothetical protein